MRTFTLMLLALALCACPAKPPVQPQGEKLDKEANDRPTSKGPKGHAVKSVKLPKSMVIGDNVSLSGFYEDDEGMEEPPPDAVGERPASTDERPTEGSGGGASQNLYKVVAPATVIVRSPRGYGTGVIYDPAGWILTNNHVIRHAKLENFRMKVNVGLGKLNKKGVMEQIPGTFEAYVHKKDPLRDMAVIKLVKPPKGLTAIKISERDPSPGQQVTSVGHAGIGLLWAIKTGQISAIGKLSKQLAELQLYESLKQSGSGLSARLRARRLEALRKQLESRIPALVIQSTADISQGDSGGPLVNTKAELVGLNAFVRSTRAARKESNFHIHVAEIRKFIKDVPAQPPQLLPNPWTEGGTMAKLGDADMDGTIDVLGMMQIKRYGFFTRKIPTAYFVDLDQDSFKGRSAPDVADVVKKKDFDAELTYMAHGRYLYAWYDSDNDGKNDILLVADGRRKRVKEGYRIGADGELTQDASLGQGALIQPKLLKDGALSQRLLAVGGQVFGHHLLPAGAKGDKRLPDPLRSVGHAGELRDLDRDKKADTVAAQGLFSSGYLFDLDQNSLGTRDVGDKWRADQSGKIDAEFTWVSMKQGYWAFYDTDDNGSFDLLFHAHRYPKNVVNEGWALDAEGKYQPDKTYVGRLMVQPELLKDAKQAATLRKVARRVLSYRAIAAGAGIKAFPDPMGYYRFGYTLKDVKRYKDVAAEVRMRSRCKGLLIDVDRDTARKAKKQKKSVVDLLKLKQFDAEFAQVRCGSDMWTFYDTRGKGSFDLVLYSSKGSKAAPEVAFQVDKQGQLSPRKKPVACSAMAVPRLFVKRRLQRDFARIGKELLSNVAPLKCRP